MNINQLIDVFKLSSFRVIQKELCTNKEDKDLSEDEIIEYTSSNPIRQYKLISQMHKFARHVYPKFLNIFLDTGIVNKYMLAL